MLRLLMLLIINKNVAGEQTVAHILVEHPLYFNIYQEQSL